MAPDDSAWRFDRHDKGDRQPTRIQLDDGTVIEGRCFRRFVAVAYSPEEADSTDNLLGFVDGLEDFDDDWDGGARIWTVEATETLPLGDPLGGAGFVLSFLNASDCVASMHVSSVKELEHFFESMTVLRAQLRLAGHQV